MSVPNRVSDPHSVDLVKTASKLKAAAPQLWADFVEAIANMSQREYDEFIDAPSHAGEQLAYQKGRMKFADTLGQVLAKCRELYDDWERRERTRIEAKAIKDAANVDRNG